MKTKAVIQLTNCYGNLVEIHDATIYIIVSPKGEVLYKVEGFGYDGTHATTVILHSFDIAEEQKAWDYYLDVRKKILAAQIQELSPELIAG